MKSNPRNLILLAGSLFSACCALSPIANAQNLVGNGDFEAGNVGFSSDYIYNSITAGALDQGSYAVAARGLDVHTAWQNGYDHTKGDATGLYFIANGSSNTSDVVWRSNSAITVTAGTAYRFEAYIRTEYFINSGLGAAAPSLKFQLGDGTNWVDLGTTISFPDPSSDYSWQLTFADGTFSDAGTYYIQLINDQNAAGGNDFGLDDIYFGLRSSAPSVGTNPGNPAPPNFDTSPFNNFPTASSFSFTAVGAGDQWFNWLVRSYANDTDNDPLSASVITQGTKGVASVSGNWIKYTPDDSATGSDSLSLRIEDGNGGQRDISVTILGLVVEEQGSSSTSSPQIESRD
jgi:hypothetical protein